MKLLHYYAGKNVVRGEVDLGELNEKEIALVDKIVSFLHEEDRLKYQMFDDYELYLVKDWKCVTHKEEDGVVWHEHVFQDLTGKWEDESENENHS